MKHISSVRIKVHHGITECRQRLRRYRSTRKELVGREEETVRLANSESRFHASEIDRRLHYRARCDVMSEADMA
jgi:hypothetical protein